MQAFGHELNRTHILHSGENGVNRKHNDLVVLYCVYFGKFAKALEVFDFLFAICRNAIIIYDNSRRIRFDDVLYRGVEVSALLITVREACPDLVFGTSYSFQTPFGVAEEEDFERLGIHIYALKATYILNSTFEDTYESHMIHAAGGVNVFGGRLQQFVAVDWEEVADLDPEVILVHRFFDGDDAEQKIEILRRCSEIAETAAMRKGQIFTLGIKKVFPCVDNIETAIQMSEWFQNCRAF